jgi:hypothetical protein
MRSGDLLPIPDYDNGKNTKRALYWKAHKGGAGTDSKRAALILEDLRNGIGISSGNVPFVMKVIGEWRLVHVETQN